MSILGVSYNWELPMEIGLYSFAENTPDLLNDGRLQSPAERLKDLLEEIELADQLGLDFYGLGEHHRPDFVASAPTTILAAAAARTKNIRLSTAVTSLNADRDLVFDLSHARGRPRRAFCFFALCIRADRSAERDLAVLRFNHNALRIELRATQQCFLDLL